MSPAQTHSRSSSGCNASLRPRRQGRLWLALAASLALASAWLLAGPQDALARATAAAPSPAVPDLAPWERIAPTPPAQPDRQAASSAPAAAGTPVLTITRSADGEILIAARAASHRAAAERLSALTQSELRLSAASALPDAGSLTINWRGRNIEQAWLALLGAGSSHALQCEKQRCRVWLLSAAAKSGRQPARSPAPPPERASSPGLTQHAAGLPIPTAPPAPAMQPDPPGLFPSE